MLHNYLGENPEKERPSIKIGGRSNETPQFSIDKYRREDTCDKTNNAPARLSISAVCEDENDKNLVFYGDGTN